MKQLPQEVITALQIWDCLRAVGHLHMQQLARLDGWLDSQLADGQWTVQEILTGRVFVVYKCGIHFEVEGDTGTSVHLFASFFDKYRLMNYGLMSIDWAAGLGQQEPEPDPEVPEWDQPIPEGVGYACLRADALEKEVALRYNGDLPDWWTVGANMAGDDYAKA